MRRRRQTVIDADDAVVEGLGDAKSAAEIACPDVGGEAIRRAVSGADDLGFIGEADERRYRTKRLLFEDAHPPLHADQHRGIEEQTIPLIAADERLRAFRHRIVYMRCNFVL